MATMPRRRPVLSSSATSSSGAPAQGEDDSKASVTTISGATL
jgi:hypothetical protein